MAKKKKQIKAKEPVRIRFKALSNGNQSIYLDIYQNGKRSYEFLKLYLIPEIDEAARVQNQNTLQAATIIKGERIKELANDKAGIKDNSTLSKMLLVDWLDMYQQQQDKKGRVTTMSIKSLKYIVVGYKGTNVRMRDIDKDYCLGFIDYVRNKYISPTKHRPLKAVTAHNYCVCLTCALNAAVRSDVISSNPFDKVAKIDRIGVPESKRAFLTIAEVKRLIETDCKNEAVKSAYLFSVNCGLRISDVEALTWGQIMQDGEQCRVELTMKKTKDPLYLPLSKEAVKWLPARGQAADNDKVFHLPHITYINDVLKAWAKSAGINKNVTFHTVRHTFNYLKEMALTNCISTLFKSDTNAN